jgi:hypothetical protein
MWRSIDGPFVPPSIGDRWNRSRLRRAALGYASHGWAVTPGAPLTGHRFDCGRPGCPIMTCHPALDSWSDAASLDPDRIMSWWGRRAHSVLLITGEMFDALEVPAALGLRALGAARLRGPDMADARGPVAVTADGQWLFLVRPGTPLRAELEHRLDVVRHGRGSWIPAAPTRTPEGPVRWASPPAETQWRLPVAEVVQEVLVEALGDRVRHEQPAVPRQLSTSRRAG